MNKLLALIVLCSATSLNAQTLMGAGLGDRILKHESQYQEALQESQLPPVKPVQEVLPSPPKDLTLPKETPCIPINTLSLTGDHAERFLFTLDEAKEKTGFTAGQCIGQQGIAHLQQAAQESLSDHGYANSQISTEAQDLSQGQLTFMVRPAYVGKVIIQPSKVSKRIDHIQNEFPVSEGDILNLHDIEQGLETMRRLPTVQADVELSPSQTAQQTDIHVNWQQRLIPLRLSLSVDNAGSRQTGRYQGAATLSFDNPLGLSDLFYVSYYRDLGDKASFTDEQGNRTRSGTHGYGVHYSVPWGYWLFSFNQQYYRYHQAIAGLTQNYDYNGNSKKTEFTLGRILYRDAHRKTTLTGGFWWYGSRSFIDDAPIDVQNRQTSGWSLQLDHKEYIGNSTLWATVAYKRGTGWHKTRPAPEEAFGEGTSHMKIINAELGAYVPFKLAHQALSFQTDLHLQWNKTPLSPQDRLAIGGRYTVRGFDGELMLMAERGWYWQNDLSWSYLQNHQAYIAVDAGHVSGPSTKALVGQSLVGAAIGVKGQFDVSPVITYDAFIGKPIKKPHRFETKNTVIGFTVGVSF